MDKFEEWLKWQIEECDSMAEIKAETDAYLSNYYEGQSVALNLALNNYQSMNK